jgi:hypothetical protein
MAATTDLSQQEDWRATALTDSWTDALEEYNVSRFQERNSQQARVQHMNDSFLRQQVTCLAEVSQSPCSRSRVRES